MPMMTLLQNTKIFFPTIGQGTGVSIFHQRLARNLLPRGVDAKVVHYSIYNEYFPFLLRFRHKKCDIIHSNADHGIFFKRNRIPLILTLHNYVMDSHFKKYTSLKQKMYYKCALQHYLRLSLKVADRIIAVSHATKDLVLKNIADFDIHVIYNGIDESIFRPMSVSKHQKSNKIRLLFAGNLTKRKGLDLLPPIMDQLGKEYELAYTSGLRTTHLLWNQTNNLIPLGKLSETKMVEEYNRADIILFPTRREGFGYIAAEGMACGKPIIATNCSSLPELVDDGKGGFLCEIDNVDDFVEKIKILGESPELRRQMGEYNRQKVLEKFTMKQMVERYIQIYQEVRSSPIL